MKLPLVCLPACVMASLACVDVITPNEQPASPTHTLTPATTNIATPSETRVSSTSTQTPGRGLELLILSLTPLAQPGEEVSLRVLTAREELALGLNEMREVIEVFTINCSQPSPHTFTFDNEIQPLRTYPALPDDSDPNQANNTAQVVLQIECVVPVAVNIKPGSFPNSINPGEEGSIPVAVLTTEAGEYGLPLAFNATTIDPLSVRFDRSDGLEGSYGAAEIHNLGHLERSIEKLLDSKGRERTRDQDDDMVLHFHAPDTSIDSSTTEACVKGEWVDAGGGVHKFFGCDSVNAVP